MFFLLIISFFLPQSLFAAPPPNFSIKNSTNVDVSACLKEFYRVAYTGEYNCTKSFDFFKPDPELQQLGFTIEKSCFLEVAKEECSIASFNFLSSHYNQFIDVLTTRPLDEDSCSHLYYKYNAIKCEPISEDIGQKVRAINIDTKINDTRLMTLIDKCDEIKTCMAPKCLYPETTKQIVGGDCETIEMRNTEFSVCTFKITKLSPDFSQYSCLEGMDFNTMNEKEEIELLTVKKECSKTIMKDFCGEKAVEDFDRHAALSVKALIKMTQLKNVVFE